MSYIKCASHPCADSAFLAGSVKYLQDILPAEDIPGTELVAISSVSSETITLDADNYGAIIYCFYSVLLDHGFYDWCQDGGEFATLEDAVNYIRTVELVPGIRFRIDHVYGTLDYNCDSGETVVDYMDVQNMLYRLGCPDYVVNTIMDYYEHGRG